MKVMKKISVLMLALIMAMAIFAGCGSDSGNDEQGIKDVTAKLQKCMNEMDVLGIYDCIDPNEATQTMEQLESGLDSLGMTIDDFEKSEYYTSMVESFKSSMPFDVATAKLDVGEIKIDGDTATAQVTASAEGTEGSVQTLNYVKVDGAWYVSADSLGM